MKAIFSLLIVFGEFHIIQLDRIILESSQGWGGMRGHRVVYFYPQEETKVKLFSY